MTVAEFLEVTSRFAPNSYYYIHTTDLPFSLSVKYNSMNY